MGSGGEVGSAWDGIRAAGFSGRLLAIPVPGLEKSIYRCAHFVSCCLRHLYCCDSLAGKGGAGHGFGRRALPEKE